jgi:hypothetical protein
MLENPALCQPKSRLKARKQFPAIANAVQGAKCQLKKTEAARICHASFAAAAGAGPARNHVCMEVVKTAWSCSTPSGTIPKTGSVHFFST